MTKTVTIVVMLTAGCGRVGYDAPVSEAGTDSEAPRDSATPDSLVDAPPDTMDSSAADTGAPLGPFGTADLIGELSSPSDDINPSLTDDFLELYFTRSLDVFVSTRSTTLEPWGLPARVEELSTSSVETDPEVSVDGLTIYFSSNRPGGLGGTDVWMSTRASRTSTWDTPIPIPELNSASDDWGVSVTGSGLHLILSSTRDGTNSDLFRSERGDIDSAWSAPTPIVELNSPGDDGTPHLVERGLHLFFCSDRPAEGELHIYEATRPSTDAPFSPPILLDLSTSGDECGPWISGDLLVLIYDNNRTGNGEIFQVRR